MKKWEYLFIEAMYPTTTNVTCRVNGQQLTFPKGNWQIFNQLGEQGWELVAANGPDWCYVFKRPIL
ncbi:MAG: hypothetical protein AABN34_20385 [Acidobacteriota bacterium]